MNFFGKKSTKKTQGNEPPLQEYKPYDFSAPDAFSEENMAKVRIIWQLMYSVLLIMYVVLQQELHGLRYHPSAQSSRLARNTRDQGRYGSTAMLDDSLSTGLYALLAARLSALLSPLYWSWMWCV